MNLSSYPGKTLISGSNLPRKEFMSHPQIISKLGNFYRSIFNPFFKSATFSALAFFSELRWPEIRIYLSASTMELCLFQLRSIYSSGVRWVSKDLPGVILANFAFLRHIKVSLS